MPTALESKAAAELVVDRAVEASTGFLMSLSGSPKEIRAALLEVVPELIGTYALGTASLAADLYEDQRELVVASSYTADTVVLDRTVKIRRGLAWASDPLFSDDWDAALARLLEIVNPETMRPYRDTILANRVQDPASVGWRRITRGGCGFCKMLADRGAVYKQATARFAAHTTCQCTAEPVFEGQAIGPEATVLQYMASKRRRTEAEKQQIRELVAVFEGR